MEEMDVDKDGKLSLTELMTDEVPKERQQELTEAFNRFDRNRDNKIDSDELPAMVAEFHDKEDVEDEGEEEASENPADIMRDLDTNKDGALSFAELVGTEDGVNLLEEDRHRIREVFHASDKNTDGKLDMQEFQSSMEEMHKRHP